MMENVPFSLEKRDLKKALYPLISAIEIKMQKDPNENNEQNFWGIKAIYGRVKNEINIKNTPIPKNNKKYFQELATADTSCCLFYKFWV